VSELLKDRRVRVPAHLARVLAALYARGLDSRPHPTDAIRVDAACPCCGGQLELRDVDWAPRSRRILFYCPSHEEDAILRALELRERDLFLGRAR
jgi:hypothetical protein